MDCLAPALIGGKIAVTEIREPGRKRYFLQGKMSLALPQIMDALGVPFDRVNEHPADEIIIDFREPSRLDADAEVAKKLTDEGFMYSQIAARIGCARNTVTKLLQHWASSHGAELQDGRARRSTLRKKQVGIPLYEQMAEEAKVLWDEGLADVQIAARLGCGPPMAIAAVVHWFQSPDLAMPSHDERRLALMDRMVSLYDQDLSITVERVSQSGFYLGRQGQRSLKAY